MTLIVCLKAADGIVLAADSRGTVGDPRGLTAITDTHVKIFGCGNHGLALAGASEMGAALLDELSKKGASNPIGIDKAVHKITQISASLFSEWFRDIPPAQRPPVLLTLAGYRKQADGRPEALVYLLNSQMSFAPQLFKTPCLSGVPQYAVYLANRYYDPTIPLDKAKALAEYLITETASQDPKVGGPVRMAVIRPDTGYTELTAEEIQQISDSNEELNQRLRKFFLEVKLS